MGPERAQLSLNGGFGGSSQRKGPGLCRHPTRHRQTHHLTPEATPSTTRLYCSVLRRRRRITRQKATSVLRSTRLFGKPLPSGGAWRPQKVYKRTRNTHPRRKHSVRERDCLGHLCPVGVISLHAPQSWVCFLGGSGSQPVLSSGFGLVLGMQHGQGQPGPHLMGSRSRRGGERDKSTKLPTQTDTGVWEDPSQGLGWRIKW